MLENLQYVFGIWVLSVINMSYQQRLVSLAIRFFPFFTYYDYYYYLGKISMHLNYEQKVCFLNIEFS